MALLRLIPNMIAEILFTYARPYRRQLLLAGLLMLVEAGLTLALPWLAGMFAGEIFLRVQGDGMRILLPIVAVLAGMALLRFAHGDLSAGIAQGILADLRIRLYDHLQSLPMDFHHQRRRGEMLSLLTLDAEHVAAYMADTVLGFIPMLVTVGGAFLIMLGHSMSLGLAVLVLLPGVLIVLKLAGRHLRPLAGEAVATEAAAVARAEENLGLLPMIKAFVAETLESQRYRDDNRRLALLNHRQQKIQLAVASTVTFVCASVFVVMLWQGSQQMGLGELVSFFLYAMVLARPLGQLSHVYGQTQQARSALERMEQVLAEPAEIFGLGRELGRIDGEICFEQVSFTYPGRPPTLAGLDLRIAPGETVAITGENGAGKSTLVHLLMRLHEPESGCIRLDGVPLPELELAYLRRQIGIVSQRVLLFNASVFDNIAFGSPGAGREAVETVARLAQAHEFICRLPEGYDTRIGDQGVRLSGGQRQRLALARALLKDPPILILDEATSMFDPEAERAFIAECCHQLRQRTVLLITHRPASLALADRVFKLRAGKLEELASLRQA